VDDLVRQILAAIEETEQDAQAAERFGGASWSVEPFNPSGPDALPAVVWVVDAAEDGMAMVNGDARARHIARHDPASVLRRCAADRRAIKLWQVFHDASNSSSDMQIVADQFLANLATAYGMTSGTTRVPGTQLVEDLIPAALSPGQFGNRQGTVELNADGQVFLLLCRECSTDVPIPFDSAEARGKWAAGHRDATGHDTWWVHDHTPTPR
jgi:hypothetical protein